VAKEVQALTRGEDFTCCLLVGNNTLIGLHANIGAIFRSNRGVQVFVFQALSCSVFSLTLTSA